MADSIRTNITVPVALWAEVHKRAELEGKTLSDYVVDILEDAVYKNNKAKG